MAGQPLATQVAARLHQAAARLHTADPSETLNGMLKRTFSLPQGDPRYARNMLTPGAAPIEPSWSAAQATDQVRVNLQPLGPEASAVDRRNEATHEMRRLVGTFFGHDALHWFDERSEAWRGFGSGNNLHFGAFFGTSHDRDGLYSSKVYYENGAGQIDALPMSLFGLVSTALSLMPALKPLFTSITAQRDFGTQRITFAYPPALRLADLQPLLDAFGLGGRMPAILQILGVTLGGRFDLPAQSTLIGVGQGADGPEVELYVLLDRVPDLPPNFLGLLTLGLSERPRELSALERWMSAFTPEDEVWPGRFSILSLYTSAKSAPRVSLYLRPAEFEIPMSALESFREPAIAAV